MTLRCKIGKDIFIFDDWQYVDLYEFNVTHPRKKWIRLLLTKNNEHVVPKENPLFIHSNIPFDPTKRYNKPRLEITESVKDTLYFELTKFYDMDAAIIFNNLKEQVYPFPQLYTEAGDYEKAKRHYDRFINIITNLTIFM